MRRWVRDAYSFVVGVLIVSLVVDEKLERERRRRELQRLVYGRSLRD